MSSSDSVQALLPSGDDVVEGGKRGRSSARHHRLRFGRAGALAVVAFGALAISGTTLVQASGNFPDQWVADIASSYVGQSLGSTNGQCIIFAENMVHAAFVDAGSSVGFYGTNSVGYWNVWADAGAQLMGSASSPSGWQAALEEGQMGDIVQLSPSPGSWYNGSDQHTFILDWSYSGSSPETSSTPIIQSNWPTGSYKVTQSTVGNILSWKQNNEPGLMLAVWQFGYTEAP